MRKFDIGIVGNGPAALCSAIYLSKLGLKVVIFCGKDNPDRKRHYGETIPINIKEALLPIGMENLPELIKAIKIKQTISAWGASKPESTDSILNMNRSGWLFDRKSFEQQLKYTATGNGVVVINDQLEKHVRYNGYWRISTHSPVNGNSEIDVGVLVLATGRKTTGLFQLDKRTTLDKLIACNLVVKIKPTEYDSAIRLNSSESGWLFSVCTGKQFRVINFFTDSDLLPAKTPPELIPYFNNILKTSSALNGVVQEIKLDDIVSFSIVPANTTFRKNIFHNGMLICGDAAQTFDPLTSHGICYAINDAINLSKSIYAMLSGNKTAMESHELKRRKIFSDYLIYRYKIYSLDRQWDESVFWNRRQNIETLKEYAVSLT